MTKLLCVTYNTKRKVFALYYLLLFLMKIKEYMMVTKLSRIRTSRYSSSFCIIGGREIHSKSLIHCNCVFLGYGSRRFALNNISDILIYSSITFILILNYIVRFIMHIYCLLIYLASQKFCVFIYIYEKEYHDFQVFHEF